TAGVLDLLGWALGVPVLKSVWPGWATMKATPACLFVLSGVSLWIQLKERPALVTAAVRAAAAVGGTVGLATVAEYLSGQSFGIDQLLFTDHQPRPTSFPGRMPAFTAVSFSCLKVASLLLDAGGMWARRLSRGLSLTVFLIAFNALV